MHEWPMGNDTMKSKMEIDPATQKDAGYYECQADNQYAVDRRGFRTDYVMISYWTTVFANIQQVYKFIKINKFSRVQYHLSSSLFDAEYCIILQCDNIVINNVKRSVNYERCDSGEKEREREINKFFNKIKKPLFLYPQLIVWKKN